MEWNRTSSDDRFTPYPRIAQSARGIVAAVKLTAIQMRIVDTGNADAYVGAVPADLVTFGKASSANIRDEVLERTIHGAPSSVVQVPASCGPIQSDAVNDRVRRRSTTSMSARAIAPSSACAM